MDEGRKEETEEGKGEGSVGEGDEEAEDVVPTVAFVAAIAAPAAATAAGDEVDADVDTAECPDAVPRETACFLPFTLLDRLAPLRAETD